MIYADYNGSAPLCPEVIEYLKSRLEDGPYANPNAIHYLGQKVKKAMERCRKMAAEVLDAEPNQIIFNSGASEGISHVFWHHFGAQKTEQGLIISGIEHSAAINVGKYYEQRGTPSFTLPTHTNGVVDLEALQEVLKEHHQKISLVCIMAANNETGVIQPYEEITKLCQEYSIKFFSDTTQLIGKASFSFKKSNLDYACLSGHKIGAMTGCGILLVKNPQDLEPFVFGGGQEQGLRGGTQNYLAIETMAVALEKIRNNQPDLLALEQARVNFEKKLKTKYPEIVIVGEQAKRLPSTTLVAYPGIHGQGIQIELESNDIFVTTSSACSDNEPTTSKVLKSMGVRDDVGRGVIRISLGPCEQSVAYYEKIYDVLVSSIEKLKKIKSFNDH